MKFSRRAIMLATMDAIDGERLQQIAVEHIRLAAPSDASVLTAIAQLRDERDAILSKYEEVVVR